VKIQQRNWIGRLHRCEITFETTAGDAVTDYTNRATRFSHDVHGHLPGASAAHAWRAQIGNWAEGGGVPLGRRPQSDFERGELNKDKTGVPLEASRRSIPSPRESSIFVSDYVLMGYGTGVVMGVPGHDQRDWDFATNRPPWPIVEVVSAAISRRSVRRQDDSAIMVNSCFLNGMTSKRPSRDEAVLRGAGLRQLQRIQAARLGLLPPALLGRRSRWSTANVRWVRSRRSAAAGAAALESYELTDYGESPLSKMTDWVQYYLPDAAAREARDETMPQWAGPPGTSCAIWTRKTTKSWSPGRRGIWGP
jgi:leucyl-tRNA synthetase